MANIYFYRSSKINDAPCSWSPGCFQGWDTGIVVIIFLHLETLLYRITLLRRGASPLQLPKLCKFPTVVDGPLLSLLLNGKVAALIREPEEIIGSANCCWF